MATFTWHDILTVSVGEMNRAQALDCARQIQTLSKVYVDYDELMVEVDATATLFAPAVVKLYGNLLDGGVHSIPTEDGSAFILTLPLTRESFNALPMSLATLWIAAMVKSNGWLVDLLKNLSSRTTPNEPEPKSGSAPLSEPTAVALTMPTIG